MTHDVQYMYEIMIHVFSFGLLSRKTKMFIAHKSTIITPRYLYKLITINYTKGLSSREAARGHATNVDGEMLSVTINRIYNY